MKSRIKSTTTSKKIDLISFLNKRIERIDKELEEKKIRFNISKADLFSDEIFAKNIEAYVIGEHGDSEFIPWSNVNIAYKKLSDILSLDDLKKIENEVRESAYEIIKRKGATAYGIGMCLVKITNAIIEDKNVILPVSSWDEQNGVCISTPAIVNRNGVKEKIFIPLTSDETSKIKRSINVIKDAIAKIE